MSTAVSIRAALEQALAAISAGIDTVYENEAYSPTQGRLYQRCGITFGQPNNEEFGAHYQETGLMLVGLLYPQDSGWGAAYVRAELIRAAFPRGAPFTKNGVTVQVWKTPQLLPGTQDGDRFSLAVRIPFFANL